MPIETEEQQRVRQLLAIQQQANRQLVNAQLIVSTLIPAIYNPPVDVPAPSPVACPTPSRPNLFSRLKNFDVSGGGFVDNGGYRDHSYNVCILNSYKIFKALQKFKYFVFFLLLFF